MKNLIRQKRETDSRDSSHGVDVHVNRLRLYSSECPHPVLNLVIDDRLIQFTVFV